MTKKPSDKNITPRPTLRQVANLAGVSLATASNALNLRPGVNKDTMARVSKAARETGYLAFFQKNQPAPVRMRAIRLITFRKHGLVIQDTPFFADLIQGLETCCAQQGYELIFSQVSAADPVDARRLKTLLEDPELPTLLLATEMTIEDLQLLDKARSPLVMLDSYFPGADIWTVGIANTQAGYYAGCHLIEQGHRAIGLITSAIPFNNMDERQLGFSQALRAAGLTLQPEHVVAVEPTIEGSDEGISQWLNQAKDLPTAFFAANDTMAAGAVRAMLRYGLKIPQQVSLIGMDNTSVCQAVTPALTSLHVYRDDLARQAINLLLDRVREASQPARYLQIGIKLVERESVAAIR